MLISSSLFFFPPYSVFFFFSSTLGTKLMAREMSLLEEKIVTIVCETRKDNSKIIIIRLNLLYVSYFVFLRINTRKLDLSAHLFFYKQFLTLKRRKLSPFLWFSPSKILDFNFTTLSNSSSIYLSIRGWKKKKLIEFFDMIQLVWIITSLAICSNENDPWILSSGIIYI